ncbi:3-phosphoshikimate 1-carboxyvinyltransferase [Nocardiopsis metallicus]|uniref:3-phosphoshikimate 1-carboxyvinyltransferase n=1 Tax=Nocardiopsis metallicus TaxID=179819 RepID=A0A840WH75_9ACTN|nr:3-phosphoshikimate 1-carboxyvinyltransferase [Nocardiopsis metallicus]MBB5494813.1 3-phosphoshikimate 1-carboxyvinyltransferase [Nocardiopsis metallicus]
MHDSVLSVSAPASGVKGTVQVPGDKSISHRALILSALAEGTSTITGLSRAEDPTHTRGALAQFGVEFTDQPDGTVVVHGGLRHEPVDVLDCGNAGTGIRLLSGVCAGFDGLSVLTGDQYLRQRPMGRVTEPLRLMGAQVDARDHGHLAPLVIRGAGLTGISYELAAASAQVKSCLLLAGLSAAGPTTVVEPHPTRAHTEEMLLATGARVEINGTAVTVHPGPLTPAGHHVPGDPSQAAFWAVAAALAGEIEMPNLYLGFGRADFLNVLRRMGADVQMEASTGSVRVAAASLCGVEITGADVPGIVDEIPVLAVAAAGAKGTTVITGAEELRVKESDRIASTVAMLNAFGVRAEERPDGMVIHGQGDRAFTPGQVDSAGDHRIAMAAAVAAVARTSGQSTITGWGSVATSYPGFVEDLVAVSGARAQPI